MGCGDGRVNSSGILAPQKQHTPLPQLNLSYFTHYIWLTKSQTSGSIISTRLNWGITPPGARRRKQLALTRPTRQQHLINNAAYKEQIRWGGWDQSSINELRLPASPRRCHTTTTPNTSGISQLKWIQIIILTYAQNRTNATELLMFNQAAPACWDNLQWTSNRQTTGEQLQQDLFRQLN